MTSPPLSEIGELVEPISSWTPERHDPDGVFTYVDLSAVDQDAKIVSGARVIACSAAPSRARQLVRVGDVLVSTVRPNLNAVTRVPPALDGATVSTGFCVLRPRPGRLDGQYLYHWVRSPRFVSDMTRKATGASYPAVSDRIVCGSKLPLPSLPEQRRIAEILDKADALRAKRRAAIAQLDSLTQAIFLDMFGDPATNPKGWPITKIAELLASASYGTSHKPAADGELPILRINNITRHGEIDLSELKHIDLPASQRDRYTVVAGDVLFNRTNSADLVGKTALYRGPKRMAYAGYLIRLRLKPTTEPEYLAAFLNTSHSKRVLRSMCKSIIGMANINATELQGISIAAPDHPLQQKFVRRIAGVRQLREGHLRLLSVDDQLFCALQHRAFRGEL